MVARWTGAVALLAFGLASGAFAQGLMQNNARQFSKLRKEAKKGGAEAQYKLGLAYADAYRVDRDYDDAVEWLSKAGEQGHVKAQLFLGRMYYSGKNVDKDERLAADWLERAAEGGDREAQWLIGNLYNNGEGRPKDFAKAAFWYRAAAEQGEPRAQYNLGVLRHNGEGVERDLAKAFKWVSLAAANPPREYPREYGWARDDMEKTLSPDELKAAQAEIAVWRAKSWDEIREAEEVAIAADGPR